PFWGVKARLMVTNFPPCASMCSIASCILSPCSAVLASACRGSFLWDERHYFTYKLLHHRLLRANVADRREIDVKVPYSERLVLPESRGDLVGMALEQ